ncbi:MAG TPA: hypothetical protein VIN71_08165, partial [Pseudomonadales bacterium]
MTLETLVASLQAALARQDKNAIAALINDINPADMADFLQQPELAGDAELDIARLMDMPLERRAETFGYLPLE